LFKELVTAVIALVVVGATMWVFIHAFDGADREVTVSGHDIRSPALLDKRIQLHEQAQSNRKDILTVGISLLSVILGFYFGRVPAERRAERAEREAGKAHDTEKQALAGARDAEDRGRGAETRAKDATHARERAEDKVKDARATVGRLQRTLAPTVQRRKTLAAAGKPAPNPEIDGAVEELNALLERLS
jgi:hypothetical protein